MSVMPPKAVVNQGIGLYAMALGGLMVPPGT
jgi:hypothetical protein